MMRQKGKDRDFLWTTGCLKPGQMVNLWLSWCMFSVEFTRHRKEFSEGLGRRNGCRL